MSVGIVSLLPAATEIAAALGLIDQVVGVSHECNFPSEANKTAACDELPVHNAGLASGEVDDGWATLSENGTIYTIDEPLLRKLQPDVILTQNFATFARRLRHSRETRGFAGSAPSP